MTASASRRRFLMRLGCISSAAAACSIPTVCAWAAGTHTPVVVSFSWFENVNSAELAKTRIDATTGASLLNHGLPPAQPLGSQKNSSLRISCCGPFRHTRPTMTNA